jgi:hypothetical protein
MENSGWVKLNRSINDDDLWLLEPFTKAQAWIDLFLNANWRPGIFAIRGGFINVETGQIAWSELTLAKRWKWSRNKVRAFKALLRQTGKIDTTESTTTSIIKILKYKHYQANDILEGTTEGTAEGTTERHQKVQQKVHDIRSKEVKEGKELKEKTLKPYCPTSENPDVRRLGKLLFGLIREYNPKAKEPNWKKWDIPIDRLIRLDKRTPEEIEKIICWCQADDFWHKNILSTEKLKKQFDQLWLKANPNGGNGKYNFENLNQTQRAIIESERREREQNGEYNGEEITAQIGNGVSGQKIRN